MPGGLMGFLSGTGGADDRTASGTFQAGPSASSFNTGRATASIARPAGASPSQGVSPGELAALRQSLQDAQAQCEALRGQVARLEGERDRAWERVNELEDYLRPILDRQKRFQRLVRRTAPQIRVEVRLGLKVAKEMHAAMQGRNLDKANKQHGKLEMRHVSIDPEEMLLEWEHHEKQGKLGGLISKGITTGTVGLVSSSMISAGTGGIIKAGSSKKSLDLRDVTRLKYGHETGLSDRFPEVHPWLCFALETADRSYEFVCPDEPAVISFVIALSRLLPDVEGALLTRRTMILRKAWCKIREACLKKGKTFANLVAEVSATLGPLEKPASKKAPTLSFCRELAGAPPSGSMTRPLASGSLVVPMGLTSSRTSGLLALDSFLAPPPAASSRAPPPRPQAPPAQPKAAAAFTVLDAPPKRLLGSWPKVGETWVFTGLVSEVDVFKDPKGQEWANQVKCLDNTSGRRAVTILSAPETTNLVEFRGMDKLKFVKGWMQVVDKHETWILEKASGAQ